MANIKKKEDQYVSKEHRLKPEKEVSDGMSRTRKDPVMAQYIL